MSKGVTTALEGIEEICLPKLGESILSATVVMWLKKEGDAIELDEPIVEVATDKVNSEIPSPVAGVLRKILVPADACVDVGAPLAQVAVTGAAMASAPEPVHGREEPKEFLPGFLSPAVLRLVREHGISLEELEYISGSGQDRRITKRDIESYLAARGKESCSAAATCAERVPLSPMRKSIADNMVRSFYQAPHAYIVGEVDVTDLLRSIKADRARFAEEHGVRLTLTSYLVRAICRMVGDNPLINASMEEEHILVKPDVNLGIAVAIEKGLVVPVVKGCQNLSVPDIARAIADLSSRAREASLQPDEVMNGTITLTNFGMSGALIGLPIIRHPEVAIIGIGAIQRRVVALENDAIGIRQLIHVTLSFDHRAVDGMYAGSCLSSFKAALEPGPRPV